MKGARLGQIGASNRCCSGAAAYVQGKPRRGMSTFKRTILLALVVVGLVLVVLPFAFATSPAYAAFPQDWTPGSPLWYWNLYSDPPETYYRLGTSIGTTMPYWGGPLFIQHAIISACRWSNDYSYDNIVYNIVPTPYDFYYHNGGYVSGQQYDHSLGFSQVDNGYVAQTFPYNSGLGWYIRFSTDFWWTTNPSVQKTRYDFQSSAAHEFGHALGVFHGSNSNHGSYTDANRPTMFALGAAPEVTWQRTPSSLGDFEGLNWIYGVQ